MKFMILVKASKDSEAGVMPNEELLSAMGKFNEELAEAGVLLAAEGLHPSSKGARVKFTGGQTSVIDGPFAKSAYASRQRNAKPRTAMRQSSWHK
jgi:hypothetical protein